MARPPQVAEELDFQDADGDQVTLVAEVCGERARLGLRQGEHFVCYCKRLRFNPGDGKVYVDGHTVTIPLKDDETRPELLAKLKGVVTRGGADFSTGEVDAESELKVLNEEQAEEDEMDGVPAHLAAKMREAAARGEPLKKRKKVPRSSLVQLVEMGVSESLAKLALARCDGTTPEVAWSWLEANKPEESTTLSPDDEPEWMEELTEEQKKEKARQLQQLAEQRRAEREKEEKQQEIEREKKRRVQGQQLAEEREKYEQAQRMKAYEERKRAAEADRKARAEIRAKIEADRAAKGWSAKPGTESSQEASSSGDATVPSSSSKEATSEEALREASRRLAAHPPEKRAGTLSVLRTLLGNLAKDPLNEKYRQIKTTNAKIRSTVLEVDGGEAFLLASGFTRQGDLLCVRMANVAPIAKRGLSALESLSPPSYHLYKELADASGEIRCTAWTPFGALVTGSMDNTVRLYPEGLEAAIPLHGHERCKGVDGVLGAAPLPDGSVATVGRDGKVIMWDLATYGAQRVVTGHGEGEQISNGQVVSCLCVTTDKAYVVTGGWDKTVRRWRVGTGEACGVLRGHTLAVNGVAPVGGDRVVSVSGDGSLKLWEGGACTATGTAGNPLRGVAAVCEGGVAVATVESSGMLRLWDSAMKKVREAQGSRTYLMTVAYHPSTGIVTGGDEGVVKVWSLALACTHTIPHPSPIWAVAVADCGDIAVGTEDGVCRVWSCAAERKADQATSDRVSAAAAAFAVAVQSSTSQAAAPPPPSSHGAQQPQGPVLTFPVEVADGRRLTISWSRGADPLGVALQFCLENRLGNDEVQTIVDFVNMAEGRR